MQGKDLVGGRHPVCLEACALCPCRKVTCALWLETSIFKSAPAPCATWTVQLLTGVIHDRELLVTSNDFW
jgi:hypothetical protein